MNHFMRSMSCLVHFLATCQLCASISLSLSQKPVAYFSLYKQEEEEEQTKDVVR